MLCHGFGLLRLLEWLFWRSFSPRRGRIYPRALFPAVDIVVAVVTVAAALLVFFVGASVDEDYHPILEFVKEVLERHGFACLSDLLSVFDPKLCGIMFETRIHDFSDYVRPVKLFISC